MIPDFALTLSFDGIRLLHRAGPGWSTVGEVPLDSPNLAGDLAALRRAGLALGVPWIGTKVVLPPEQVRFMALDDPEADDAAVRAALDGATPYAVGDLVIDHLSDATRTHVAAVARETLEEAEAFAAEHGFQPVCFTAPWPGGPAEAFFGPTRLAAAVLGGQPVTREPPPAAEAPPAAPPVAPPADAPPATLPAAPVAVPEAEPDDTPQIARAPRAARPPSPEPPTGAPPEPPPAALSEPLPAAAPPLEPRPAPDASSPVPGPSAPLSPTGVPQPIFASRAKPLRAPPREEIPADMPLSGAIAKARASGSAKVPPTVSPPSGSATPAKPAIAQARTSPALAAPARAPQAALVPARKDAAVTAMSPAVPAAPRRAAVAPSPLPAEGTAPARFGLRRGGATARIGGKPRHLGLILTVALLLLMAAAAVMASVAERNLAALLGFTPQATPVAAPEPAAVEAAAPAPLAPVAPADVAPADVAPVEIASPTLVPPAPEAQAAAVAAVAAAIRALPPEAAAPEEPPLPASAPTPGTAVSPVEAERVYAATGVWLRVPGLPDEPSAATLAPPAVALSEDKAPASALPMLVATTADRPVPAPADPPAPGARTPPDDGVDGGNLLLAALGDPETPEGVRVVAGEPPLVPPTRPGTVAPAAAPPGPASEWVNAMAEPPGLAPRPRPADPVLPNAMTATAEAEPAAPASEWVNAMAEPPALAPRPRPADPILPDAMGAASPPTGEMPPVPPGTVPPGSVPPGSVGLAAFDGPSPAPRPGDAAPEAEPGSEPEALAAFDGPSPASRPEGLAPEPLPELPSGPDVTDAIAEALAAPEAPAPAPQPDVQTALAAIAAGGADPLAGATPRAVPVARVPDSRPRNFDRVVRDQLDRIARASQPREAPRAQQGAGGVGTGNLAANERAEAGEAEVASSAAAVPSGPTAATVAGAATFADAMALREMNLIGVYGQPGARRALVRMGNGRYLRVGVGDSLDGGQVTAIGDNALNYVKRGRTEVLVIPGG